MRLIDADAFIEENAEIIDCEINHPKYQDTIRELIDEAPTVEARQHGEWICEGAMADYTNVLVFRCSVCEEHFVGHAEDKKSRHFCPNCGADMRKEGDKE